MAARGTVPGPVLLDFPRAQCSRSGYLAWPLRGKGEGKCIPHISSSQLKKHIQNLLVAQRLGRKAEGYLCQEISEY